MSERYPEDAALLALEADAHTGVEYIRTGQSPYYLAFRRMLHRLLEATRRANDLRVYQAGDLSIGVRSGRCVVHDTAIAFEGADDVTVENNATTHVWLNAAGEVQTATDGLPEPRRDFVPLAKVETEAGAITAIEDLRGEVFLAVPSLALLGVEATAETLNAALADAEASVTSAALNALTAGATSAADAYHQHVQAVMDADAMEPFSLINNDGGDDANVALSFVLPSKLTHPVQLHPDTDGGWLKQTYGSETRAMLGAVQASYAHEGQFTGSQSGKLIGAAPVEGQVVAVVLSAGQNIESSESADAIEAAVKVNGQAVTSTHARLRAEDGGGFRSTDQGDGVAAVIVSNGTEQVQRGDVLSVDLTRTASGTVSEEASDLVVMVVIRAAAPE